MLYNVENWATLSSKKLNDFTTENFLTGIGDTKASIIHRKFLKYILGVSKSCPTIALMGETNELPLMLKGYTLMLKYWYRLTFLPNESLVKKALLENIAIRTNWIITVEKLVNSFRLNDSIQTISKFSTDAGRSARTAYIKHWNMKMDSDISRLEFYKKVKKDFNFEEYLNIPSYSKRRSIAKLRCSDHNLEIEKGRHKKIPREERLCPLCLSGEIETEEHFLIKCNYFVNLRAQYIQNCTLEGLFRNSKLENLGRYLITAFEKRKNKLT